jgi:hypothetical protein
MMASVVMLLLSGTEVIDGTYRAVTLEPHEHRAFRVPGLETVTASTGRCIEEGMESDQVQTLFLEATCGGVRTTLAWRKDGVRVHLMACAEADDRPAPLVALRKTVQAELKALKGVKTMTACVRNGRVELWGWTASPEDLQKLTQLEKKHGLESVRSFVEALPD